MLVRRYWWVVVACAAVVCAAVSLLAGSAAGTGPEPEADPPATFVVAATAPVRELTPDEEQDLAGAGLAGTSAAALVGGQDLAAVVARLQQEFPDAYSDAAIESGAGHQAWISFAGRAPAGAVAMLQGLPIAVQVREGAPLTEVQRLRAVEIAMSEVVHAVGPVSAAAGMTQDGVLAMTVQDDGRGVDGAVVEARVAQAVETELGLDRAASIRVQVDVVSGPVVTPEVASPEVATPDGAAADGAAPDGAAPDGAMQD